MQRRGSDESLLSNLRRTTIVSRSSVREFAGFGQTEGDLKGL
jgi:hypothetical protein